MSLDAPNAISGEPSPQTDNAHICDCVHRWNATKVVPFEYIYLLKYVWSLYQLFVHVIFVPLVYCLFMYLFICVCVCVYARTCVYYTWKRAGFGDLRRASDDFLHTSSHGILHLSVVHSRYTWWDITFKVKELSAIWDSFLIYAFVGRNLFRQSLSFLKMSHLYTLMLSGASGADNQSVHSACTPKFNLYANTGEPISKVVCLWALQLLCSCDR